MERARMTRLRCSSAISCRLVRSRSGGTASRSASVRSRRFSDSRGSAERRRPTRQACRSRRAAGIGFILWTTVCFGWISPASRRSMATWPSTQTTTSLASTSAWVTSPGQDHGFADRFPQRRDPEVVLELGERGRERLGHRARTEIGPRAPPDLGRHGARPEGATRAVGDGPLDVLRAAVDGVGLGGERHEPAEVCLPSRAVVGGELERFRGSARRARTSTRRPPR